MGVRKEMWIGVGDRPSRLPYYKIYPSEPETRPRRVLSDATLSLDVILARPTESRRIDERSSRPRPV